MTISERNILLDGDDQYCFLPEGVTLCYRIYGNADAIPLVLIAGLGLQLSYWPPKLVQGLVNEGFRVIIFDNRDSGCSSRSVCPVPSLWRQILWVPSPKSYGIEAMADDLSFLLNQLGITQAHLVGMSMGGMIAQTFAIRHPKMTASLTSIFSTTGSRQVGQPAISSILMMMRPPAASRDQAISQYRQMARHIGPTRFNLNPEAVEAYAANAWDRCGGTNASEGVARQLGAIIQSGDRTSQLSRIDAPTLVIHGDQDLMVNTSGGYATAAAIRQAKLKIIPGMGHFIGEGVTPELLDLILDHAIT
ncbi:alpha/beta hydrolase [Acinetobacter modestus]|uniref:alpha/beta fold hydrolase n=1 Tax=Acinetobacter modestus TaxID=1776740 RepID=UPI00202DF92D|nr:alpha/beta hydrolase [Acinetobacter modestus]MCM1959081.1 alpha/beta hydrolase [Acinetobacter modestus]